MLKSNILGRAASGFVFSVLLSSGTFAAGEFTDDFSGESLAAENWDTPELQRYINETDNTYVSAYSQSSLSEDFSRNRLRANSSGLSNLNEVTSLAKIKELGVANNTISLFARVEGSFFTTAGAYDSDDATGTVFAAIYFGERHNGLEIWWKVEESTSPNWSTSNIIDEGILVAHDHASITLNYDTFYLLQLAYDGTDFQFNFAQSDGTTDLLNQNTPAPTFGATIPNFHAAVSTGSDFADGGDGAEVSSILAEFDEVVIGHGTGSILDDFSSPNISSDRWKEHISGIDIDNGKLLLTLTTESPGALERYRHRARLADRTLACLFAKVTYGSATNIPNNEHRARVRLEGQWFNDTYPGEPYNDVEGDVFANVSIELRNGALRAVASVWRENADFAGGTDLMFEVFDSTVVADEDYTMYIERDEATKQLRFHFNGETKVYQAMDMYPVSPNNHYRALAVRIKDFSGAANAAEGYVEARFDDVFSGARCPEDDDDDFLLLIIPSIISATIKD